jgi:hypothetical protein
MRLKDYGRNSKKRKVYVNHSGLLLVGIGVTFIRNLRPLYVLQDLDQNDRKPAKVSVNEDFVTPAYRHR